MTKLRRGPLRVLFMEDDPHISALTAAMLESLDHAFDLAKNGEEAIALYQRSLDEGCPYDAVILDLTVIGGMGGQECFQKLRELHHELRAIAATGYDDQDLRRRCLDLGFAGFLTKPYRAADLTQALKSVLESPPPLAR